MTKAMSLQWHQEALINWKASITRKEQEFAKLKAELEKAHEELSFYENQINEAILLGKDAFDRDRLLVKRNRLLTKES